MAVPEDHIRRVMLSQSAASKFSIVHAMGEAVGDSAAPFEFPGESYFSTSWYSMIYSFFFFEIRIETCLILNKRDFAISTLYDCSF